MKNIVIIDGQGGGFGRALIEKLCQQRPDGCRIIAVGTNATATAAMMKAGADVGATGENPVVVNSATADIIAGPMGIVLANSMLGEFTTAMAAAVAGSTAQRVLIPVTRCSTFVAGVAEKPLTQYIADAAVLICTLVQS